ncbi:hypothetical protein LIER_27834 [Lithospermum erythrorhizon]|uniref:Uncharacterized protein n=1 Tax=Lithospermum erythrorhizon TaxID=34254 RepID=A0AAV3RDS2_LITER
MVTPHCNHGPERRTSQGAPQGEGAREVAEGSSSPSQQPPLGSGIAGSRSEEGPGGEGCYRPGRPYRLTGEGGLAARLPPA